MTTTTFPNWFAHYAQGFFEKHLAEFAGKPDLRFLQVGVFTGDATVWLLENVLTGPGSTLDDVDTWRGSDEPEHEAFDWADVEREYDVRTKNARAAKRLNKFVKPSAEFWNWAAGMWDYDFIYLDGAHTACDVLTDATGGFRYLRVGGLLAFDDYLWKPSNGRGETHAPGIAIDAFLDCYRDRIQVLQMGLQVWVRKLS